MKVITKNVLAVALALGTLQASSQVAFTNMGSQLQPISGSSARDCAVDMNGDNLDDIVRVTNAGIYIDYQLPGGGFNGVFYPLNIQNMPNWSIAAADIDENGYTDLLFGNGSRVSFVMFNDDGTAFMEDARPEYIFSQRSTFADIDNDGAIDAFVCHDVDQSHPYRNDGNGNLVLDISLIPTLDEAGNYSAIWVDYDNDNDIDLYITKCSGGAPAGSPRRINLLYRNNGDGTFTEVGEDANMDDDDQSWTTVFEDFDNDGWFDAYIANHAWANRLMHNNGDGTFTDIIAGSGLNANDLGTWNCDGHDFDNNGFVDIFCQTNAELYLNQGNNTFVGQDLAFNTGGVGDFNNDGFLDVIRGNGLWMNNGNANNWVKFNLEGLVSNKDGIGARVEIFGDWGIQVREVRSGESFAPMGTLSVHFGIGDATSIDQVVVKWPSGLITTLNNPEINTVYEVIEAPCIADPSTISSVGATSICPGEMVTLSAQAGDSYTWSNGATTQTIEVSQSGTYYAIVWIDECAAVSNEIQVEVITQEDPSIALNGEDVICEGQEVELIAGPATSWEWSNGMTGQTITVSTGGQYSVTITGLCENVQLTSETITITALDAAELPVVTDIQIGEPGSVELTASGENIYWYANEDDVVPVEIGNTYTTDVISTNATFWVEANRTHGGEEEDGGKLNNLGYGGLPSSGAHSFFNAWEAFTLESVRVYVPSNSTSGIRTVQLVNGDGIVLQEAEFDLAVGEHVIDLNFEVPVGQGMSLRCTQHNLFRNNSGVSYPYAIGTVGEIYDSVFGTSYYYYFYDWKVRKQEFFCPSPRVAVNVTVVGVAELAGVSNLKVYPNPASDVLVVELDLEQPAVVGLLLTDVTGRIVASEQLNGNGVNLRHTMPLNLASGTYNLSIEINGKRTTQRILVD